MWVNFQQDHPNRVTMCTNTRKHGLTESQKICGKWSNLKIEVTTWAVLETPGSSHHIHEAGHSEEEEKDAFLVRQLGEIARDTES